ncbi:acetyl-CoA carboxylase biotin carboxylase subunit [Dactylosporangium sp. AC04546]|uniref:acetyl-CoA carboxylase biotin carboxylase subunit n=1 Tax=Dactylosporangium sp. AC04546 TaxID=2862460 RepID=UPI001EE02E3F|nr:acetyl-CoA carboxylase biotin carboxylase subunit [Dactylosporangium sp. AC04546]WVK79065.1 acetyl-CoA carboxylase biotin carboxylase subunit [Dactylosporangium sp. AC04546]
MRTVLIANRGEIAVRIARTCREMGLRTVAVYSRADADAAVLDLADEAVCIGEGAPRRSYLDTLALLEAAVQRGADAVHPGYGFLSENADFAELCAAAGLTFVGPPAPVMAALGDKIAARRTMADAGVPVLPGSAGPVRDERELLRVGAEIGYPFMVKAAAGGGGRGIRLTSHPGAAPAAFRETRHDAAALFGDDRVYLERYVEQARHLEVQILADGHGNVVSLGERDCTVQRRHQKLVEESPAPGLDPATREALHDAAVRGARRAGYVGAGTWEFLLDAAGRFHFTEVNCRLQVEHPVTEMVTGVDIVRQQLLIADGQRLDLPGVTSRGAAVECRINAEDPQRGFLPTAGLITDFRPPGGPFTRVDTHCYGGCRIPAHYDSLLAKVITWGADRAEVLARMDRALAELVVAGPGIRTTAPFLRTILADPRFAAARHTTTLLDPPVAEAQYSATTS